MEEMCTKQFFIKFEKEIYMSYSKKTLLTENSILEKTIFQFYVKKCYFNIKKKKRFLKRNVSTSSLSALSALTFHAAEIKLLYIKMGN